MLVLLETFAEPSFGMFKESIYNQLLLNVLRVISLKYGHNL